jgi:hypothetical protein
MGPNRRPAVAAATLGADVGETGRGRAVVERTTEQEGTWTCERCGAVRPADWTCSCGGDGKSERLVPEGWDPELTRTGRPRLGLVARPEPPEAAE